jgi:uncharacterized protein (TIGR02147 family)
MINIFEFTDFRAYLRAYFSDRKKTDPGFSHRWLAGRLELATSNFILLVMQARRNLNSGLCLKISEVFKHSRKEAEYFENMVNFAQAKTSKEKDLYFTRMAALRKNLKIAKIEESQYDYYSNWYNPVIRELVAGRNFDANPATLCKLLQPAITPAQAKRSLELLLKFGMIKKQGNRYVQSSPVVATGPEVNSLAVVNFHKVMGQLAVESLDRIPKNQRNITASTIYIPESMFDTIRKKIDDFRKELLALADSIQQGGRVYQINFQVFPVTKEQRNQEH